MSEEFDIIKFLKAAVNAGASDEHLKVGHAPYIRKDGFIKLTNYKVLSKDDLEKAIVDLVPSTLKTSILEKCDLDFMFEINGLSRFRVNYNRQLGYPALVIRNIPYIIPKIEDLGLPSVLNDLINYQNGIILVTGPTGSGKSTTIASLINNICLKSAKHIITIEDPVEYVYNCKKSIVSQRQVGVDTSSFADGIKYALRQDPDVIFIGEIRDKETMAAALKASETGHLVFTTLHTNDAVQTINRIVNMFEESNRHQIRKQLAETLRVTIAQKLVYSESMQKRYPACEILVSTPAIKDYIIKEKVEEIYDLIIDNNIDNMLSLNSSLVSLVNKGKISQAEAIANSNDEIELEKIFRGVYQGSKNYYE